MSTLPADGPGTVRTLFQIPLAEPIDPVVQVAALADDRSLIHEIGSTIVTPLVERHLTALATAFAGTRPASTVGTGVWIDGAYGSGKSHLAKLLALFCTNRPLDGIGAGRRLIDRISPEGDARGTLERALRALEHVETQLVALSLATLAGSSDASLGQELLVRHYQGLGYCDNLLYARVVEAPLARHGKLVALRDEAAARARVPWAELRANPSFYGRHLAEAAAAVAPEQFSSAREVERAIDLAARGTRIDLEVAVTELGDWLAQRAQTQKRDQRLVCILDEAGAWLGRDAGRLAQLGQLLELVQRIPGQPLWVIVVTHANLEEVADRTGAEAADRRAIESRFRLRMSLDDENLTRVLEGRVLAKTDGARCALRRLYAERGGAIRDLGELAGARRVLPTCDEQAFVARYPFAPYSAELTAALVRSLRSRAGHDPELGGSTRTLLALTQRVLRGPDGVAPDGDGHRAEPGPAAQRRSRPPADRTFGSWVPFDALYSPLVESADVPSETAREVRLAVRRIEQRRRERLDAAPPCPDLPAASVEMATRLPPLLALLDALPFVPRTTANLARLLADGVEDDVATLAACLGPVLDWLETIGVVGRLAGQFELLVGTRRRFEEQVALAARAFDHDELVARLAAQTTGRGADLPWSSWLGLRSVELCGAQLSLRLWVDRQLVTPRGDLDVRLLTPLATAAHGEGGSVGVEALERRSVRPEERSTVFVWCAPCRELEAALRRLFARRDVLARFDAGSDAERRELVARERVVDAELRERALDRLRSSVERGRLVYRGSQWTLAGRSAGAAPALSAVLSELAASIYPKLRQVPVRIGDPAGAIGELVAGRIPAGRDMESLGLWDADGTTVTSHPLLDGIRVALSDAVASSEGPRVLEGGVKPGRRRARESRAPAPSTKPEAVRGADLVGRLRAPPYGWDPSVVRLGVAALVREGAVELRTARRTSGRLSPSELAERLSDRSRFDRTLLVLTDAEPDRVDWADVREIVVELLGTRSVQETEQALDEAIGRLGSIVAGRVAEACAWYRGAGLAAPSALGHAAAAWVDLGRAADPSARFARFVRDAERLRAGFALAGRYARWLERWGADAARVRIAAARLEPFAGAVESVGPSHAVRRARFGGPGAPSSVRRLAERVRCWSDEPAGLVDQPMAELLEIAEQALGELALLSDALRSVAHDTAAESPPSTNGAAPAGAPTSGTTDAPPPVALLSSPHDREERPVARALADVVDEVHRAVSRQLHPGEDDARHPVERRR